MNADRLLAHYKRIADGPDTVSRLRRFVLDLAVRGKLVDQDSDDEPAAELLKRIAKEKARLVTTGAIRKPRELSNEEALVEPFEIPTLWRWCRLDTIGAIIGGGTPSAALADNFADSGQGVPWLTPADLGGHSGLYIERGSRDLSQKGLRSSSATLMPAGTVLFSSRAPIGYVSIAENPISTNQGFKSIVPYVRECSRFIAIAMQAFAPEINANAPGTTFREVSGKIVAGQPFPLPPLAEQHRIVAKVDELMALCDRLDAARADREATRDRLSASSLARLDAPDSDPMVFRNHAAFALEHLTPLTTRRDQIKALCQTILNLAVRGKLVEQDPNDEPAAELLKRIAKEKTQLVKVGKFNTLDSDLPRDEASFLFSVPSNWAWCYLDDLAAIARGGSPRPIKSYLTDDPDGIPWIKIGDSLRGHIYIDGTEQRVRPEGLAKSRLVFPGDLLLSNSMSVGYPYITNLEGCIHDGWLVIRTPDALINKLYLHTLFLSDHAKAAFSEAASGAVVQNLNTDKARRLSVPLPPLAEQDRIVAMVDELRALCDRLEASLTTGDDTRCRLLGALLIEALELGGSYASEQVERAAAHG